MARYCAILCCMLAQIAPVANAGPVTWVLQSVTLQQGSTTGVNSIEARVI